jgi:hypothetical protein
MAAILDPELVRQLSISADTPVQAVVRLRPQPGTHAQPPEETERIAKELVSRTQKASGEHEDAVNVFKYLGSFAISAKPAFLKALIAQPEVAAALANNQPESGMIQPVEKRPARIEDVGRDSGKRVKPAARKPSRTRSSRTPTRSKSRRAAR